MSIADALRVISLEAVVAEIAERNRALVARVAALEDHLVDFQAAVEARRALELSTAAQRHRIPFLRTWGLAARP